MTLAQLFERLDSAGLVFFFMLIMSLKTQTTFLIIDLQFVL